jgi:hypothetical protein
MHSKIYSERDGVKDYEPTIRVSQCDLTTKRENSIIVRRLPLRYACLAITAPKESGGF